VILGKQELDLVRKLRNLVTVLAKCSIMHKLYESMLVQSPSDFVNSDGLSIPFWFCQFRWSQRYVILAPSEV